MANLNIKIGNIFFKNPIIGASGTVGFGQEYDEIFDISMLGGISTKGLTLEPRLGNATPRIAEGYGVILNAVGLQNPGIESFLGNDLPYLKKKNIVIIANVAGKTLQEYAEICTKLDGKVDMIELNISCPNVKCGGMAFGIQPKSVEEVTKIAKAALKYTSLIVKLSPNVENIANNAIAAECGGADCISLVNTFTGMLIDINKRRPILANNFGGVSGAGIKPIALRMVYEACQAVKIPVIGMGGIQTEEDVIAFLLAGATAVQIGTANFTDTMTMPKIITALHYWLDKNNVHNIHDLKGQLQLNS